MTAPLTRTVDQLSGDVIPAGAAALAETLDAGLPVANTQLAQAAEIARLRSELAEKTEQLANARCEIDDIQLQKVELGNVIASLTKTESAYQTERDDAREDAEILRGQLDDMRDRAEDAESLLEVVREERDWLTERVQELTAEERDAEARDAAVNDAADAVEAGEEL